MAKGTSGSWAVGRRVKSMTTVLSMQGKGMRGDKKLKENVNAEDKKIWV